MGSKLLDIDSILSENDQWTKLDLEWGNPIDLETEDDRKPTPAFSCLDLRKTTFNSPEVFKKERRPAKRSLPPPLDYKEFLQDLKEEQKNKEVPIKQFYFISGQILSAFSVEEICDNIDDIFKSVEQLCSATSTVRHKKPRVEKRAPEVVHCSISAGDLSFDDTEECEKEKSDSDDIDRFIDEAFAQLNSTIAHVSREDLADQSTRETVTTLVRKFSTMLCSPVVMCSPRRQRRCNDKFRDLAEFWRIKAMDDQ